MRKMLMKIGAVSASLFMLAMSATSMPVSAGSTDRYTVLVLDVSGSMYGTPLSVEKEAAEKFCEDILSAEGNNYVALVTMESSARVLSDFTTDMDALRSQISTLTDLGGTNFSAALTASDDLLQSAPASAIRNLVFCSDGLPCEGEWTTEGRYAYSDQSYAYSYANYAYTLAEGYKSDYNIYTLGFFHSLYGSDLAFGRRFMADLASDPEKNYYDVTDTSDLIFTFGDIANDLTTGDNDPIILIPGIMGSRLFTSSDLSEQCWPPVVGTNLTALNENMMESTLYVRPALKQNDLSTSDREYGAQDCMKTIVESMCTKYPDRDVYVFSYDWRKSNEVSADKLNEFIESLNVPKVDIVAHSMGGLVTSKYYVKYGNTKLDKIITCGTPYEGAPKLIDAVQNWNVLEDPNAGFFEDIGNTFSDFFMGLNGGLTKAVKSSFSGVCELTPTRNYFSVIAMQRDSWAPFSLGDYDMTYDQYVTTLENIFTQTRYQNAKNFQESLHDGEYNALLKYDNSYFVVGTGRKTITAVKFQYSNDDIDEVLYEDDLSYSTKGDGTVPYLSASIMEQIENLDDDRWTAISGCSHGDTVTNSEALVFVQNILSSEVPVTNHDVSGSPYTVIRIACPVSVTVRDGDEVLCSANGEESFTAEFGRLDLIGQDHEIKMLCVDSDKDLDVEIQGTGEGTMDYTISYYDGDDRLLSTRRFQNVPITTATVIHTQVDPTADSVLSIDANGDGVEDRQGVAAAGMVVNMAETAETTTATTTTTAPATTTTTAATTAASAPKPASAVKTGDSAPFALVIVAVLTGTTAIAFRKRKDDAA